MKLISSRGYKSKPIW